MFNVAASKPRLASTGNATCTLKLSARRQMQGWLMGEERSGMPIMFHMMNEERQGVRHDGRIP